MAAGHIVNGQCVDVAASTDLLYSSVKPSVTAGNPAFFSLVYKEPLSGGSWKQDTYQNGTKISSVYLPTPTFAYCETTQTFNDGMQLGWAVAAAMVIVYVIRRVYR